MPLINFLKSVVNFLSAPQYLVTLMLIGVLAAIYWRPLWTKKGGIVLFALLGGGIGLSYFDPNFAAVATLPDNVPIVGMIFLVGFFFWYAMYQAYENDRRVAAGQSTIEGQDSAQKVFSWPDLVYIELIALVIVMAVLIVWSIALKAPLEEPANPTDSPNPAKAPWYFLGLQEMLVYYDPWLAGVVLPSLIIVGLMAIPYIDTNPKGNGYFTFKDRRWEITIFVVGFIVLWCSLIALGTFLRGPNWNFFGPYDFWDVNKLVPLNNINLSEIIWIQVLKKGLPNFWLWREIFGLALVGFYVGALPLLLSKTLLRRFYEKMGMARYLIGVTLALIMLALPIKMYLRWIFNLKYIVNIPEFAFNI
jgi:cytochrome b/b6/petD-like protein